MKYFVCRVSVRSVLLIAAIVVGHGVVSACASTSIPPLESLHTSNQFSYALHLQENAAESSLRCSVAAASRNERYRYLTDATWSFLNAALIAHKIGQSQRAGHDLLLAQALYQTLMDHRSTLSPSIDRDIQAMVPLLHDAVAGRWPVL